MCAYMFDKMWTVNGMGLLGSEPSPLSIFKYVSCTEFSDAVPIHLIPHGLLPGSPSLDEISCKLCYLYDMSAMYGEFVRASNDTFLHVKRPCGSIVSDSSLGNSVNVAKRNLQYFEFHLRYFSG